MKTSPNEYFCFVIDHDGHWYKIPVSEKSNFNDWVELTSQRYLTEEIIKRLEETHECFDDYRCMHPVNYMFKEIEVLKENNNG
jgi:hypothetical protein